MGADGTPASALGAVSAACWAALVFAEQGLAPFPICASGERNPFDAGALAHGALMLGAMMAPLAISPLLHVRARSFARRRARASALFLMAYASVWCLAGAAVFSLAKAAGFAALVGVAALWQVSPGKQWMLNRCHNRRALAAFGWAADLDALRYGLQQGAACAGACAALMAAPMALDRGALPAMGLVSLLLFVERLDRPAPLGWRLRPSAKTLRALGWMIASWREAGGAWVRGARSRRRATITTAKRAG
jgi:predicted metal-binding membrane protein